LRAVKYWCREASERSRSSSVTRLETRARQRKKATEAANEKGLSSWLLYGCIVLGEEEENKINVRE
jgi:hypothetical protein